MLWHGGVHAAEGFKSRFRFFFLNDADDGVEDDDGEDDEAFRPFVEACREDGCSDEDEDHGICHVFPDHSEGGFRFFGAEFVAAAEAEPLFRFGIAEAVPGGGEGGADGFRAFACHGSGHEKGMAVFSQGEVVMPSRGRDAFVLLLLRGMLPLSSLDDWSMCVSI